MSYQRFGRTAVDDCGPRGPITLVPPEPRQSLTPAAPRLTHAEQAAVTLNTRHHLVVHGEVHAHLAKAAEIERLARDVSAMYRGIVGLICPICGQRDVDCPATCGGRRLRALVTP